MNKKIIALVITLVSLSIVWAQTNDSTVVESKVDSLNSPIDSTILDVAANIADDSVNESLVQDSLKDSIRSIIFIGISGRNNPEIVKKVEQGFRMKLSGHPKLESVSKMEMKQLISKPAPRSPTLMQRQSQLIQHFMTDWNIEVNLSKTSVEKTRRTWYLFFLGKQVFEVHADVIIRDSQGIVNQDQIISTDTVFTDFCGVIKCDQTNLGASERIKTQNNLTKGIIENFGTFINNTIDPPPPPVDSLALDSILKDSLAKAKESSIPLDSAKENPNDSTDSVDSSSIKNTP